MRLRPDYTLKWFLMRKIIRKKTSLSVRKRPGCYGRVTLGLGERASLGAHFVRVYEARLLNIVTNPPLCRSRASERFQRRSKAGSHAAGVRGYKRETDAKAGQDEEGNRRDRAP